MTRGGVLAIALCASLLSACGSDEDQGSVRQDLSGFDTAAIAAFVEGGQYQRAIDIIKFKEDQEMADREHYLLATRIYLDLLDGVAAEVYIDKSREAGASVEDTALQLARAFLLQRKFNAAAEAADAVSHTGEDAYEYALLRGDIEREIGNLDTARYHFRDAISRDPEDFRGYLALALLSLSQGDLTASENLAAKAASLVEDDTIIRYVRGTVARYQGRQQDARTHLQQAIDLHEANLHAHFELIGLLIDSNELDVAEEQLGRLYELVPESYMAKYFSALLLVREGKFEEAEYLMLRTGDLTHLYPPAGRVYGHLAFSLEKYLTAQPYLADFLRRVPQDRLTRLALSESYTRRGAPEKALELLTVLLNNDASDLEAYLQAAAAEGALGNMRGARHYFETAYRLAAQRPETEQQSLRQLGRRLALARFMSGQAEEAKAQLRRMYGDDESDTDSLTLLFNLHIQEGDIDAAEAVMQQIVANDPASALSANLQGTVAARRGRHEEALGFFDRALAVNPRYLSALKNRAFQLVGLEEYGRAKEDLLFLEEAAPQDGQVKAMLGRTFFELGDTSSAINRLREAEDAIPGSAIIKADYAEALAGSGFAASALAKARQALALSDNMPGLQQYLRTMIGSWEAAEAERKAQEEAARAEALERFRAEQAEREAQRQRLLEEAGGDEGDEKDPPGEGETQEPSDKASDEDAPDEDADEEDDPPSAP